MTVSMQSWSRGDVPNWKMSTTAEERQEAISMWLDGFDTYEIAHELHIYEAVIYILLPEWRGKP